MGTQQIFILIKVLIFVQNIVSRSYDFCICMFVFIDQFALTH